MSTNTREGIGKAPMRLWGPLGPWKLYRISGRVKALGTGETNNKDGAMVPLYAGPSNPEEQQLSLVVGDEVTAFKLVGFDLECRPEQEVTLISAVSAFRSTDLYLAVRNHTTGKTFFSESTLRRIFLPSPIAIASGVGGISLGLAGLGLIGKRFGIGIAFVAGVGVARFVGLRKLVAFKRATDFDAYFQR